MKEENKEEKISKRVCAIEVMRWVKQTKLASIASLILLFLSTGLVLVSDYLGIIVMGSGSGLLLYFTYKAYSFEKYLREKYGV